MAVAAGLFPTPAFALQNWIGKQKALVLLLQWQDEPPQVSAQQVDDAFFGPGLSMRQYFLENSAGKYDLTGKVLNWRMADRDWARWWSWTGCDPELILDLAWKAFGKDINIADYDSDHDGKIDQLFVIHSGRVREARVGPYCVFTNGGSKYADNAMVIQSQGLGTLGKEIPIGFYIHESGHALFGLGDYYGSDYTQGKYGIGMWGIMGLGAWGTRSDMPIDELFRYPSHYEPASKVRIGWANVKPLLQDGEHVVLHPVETSAEIAVAPISERSNYYLEYRSARGFSKSLPGHGLLIWKDWELMQADGRDDLNNGNRLGTRPLPPNHENFGDAGDPFPGSTGRTFFVDPNLGLVIEHIQVTDDSAQFDVRYLGRDRPSAWDGFFDAFTMPASFLGPRGWF